MSELARLLGAIEPRLHAGVYAFTSVPPGTDLSSVPVARGEEAIAVLKRLMAPGSE
jgi:hypothetical protein